MTRRAFAPSTWSRIRKQQITVPDLDESGKAPPAHIPGRKFPGERVKTPAVQIVSEPEELKMPSKAGEEQQPVSKPLPAPSGGESKDDFISRCMSELSGEFPDEKQRYAVCQTQFNEGTAKARGAEPESGTGADEKPHQDGVAIALVVPEAVAKTLAVKGGQEPGDMHITIGYYGKLGEDITPEQSGTMIKCMSAAAKQAKPLKAAITGVGRFAASDSSPNQDVIYASVDSPEMEAFRDKFLDDVAKCSSVVKQDTHSFTPHITLAYIGTDDPAPVDKINRQEIMFTQAVLMSGKSRHRVQLGETDVKKAIWCPIIKADEEKRLVTGIVLQPEVVDAQGDVISADVIEKAAHSFLANYNKRTQMGLQHKQFPPGIHLVESWIAPVEMKLAGKAIIQGTWLATVFVENDEIWSKVKDGSIRGFSIGGVAKVQRLDA